MADNPKDERVGYKRPPKHSQYPPGVSGNPSGRPRGSRSWQRDLRDELSELVRTREGEMTKQRAVFKTLVSNAIQGDARAIAVLLSTCARVFGVDGIEDHDNPPAAEEFELVKDFVAREERRRAAVRKETKFPCPPEPPTKGEETNEA